MVQPVAEARGDRAGRLGDLLEGLEGVDRGHRLAGDAAQIRMERPAKAAVAVGVGRQRREGGLGVAVAEQQLEPAPVEQPGVGVHVFARAVQIGHWIGSFGLTPARIELGLEPHHRQLHDTVSAAATVVGGDEVVADPEREGEHAAGLDLVLVAQNAPNSERM